MTDPVPGVPAPQRRSRGRLGGLLVLVLVAAAGGLGYWLQSDDKDHINRAAVGDCVREMPDDDGSSYRVVDCADPAATFRVLQLKPLGDANDCRAVAGASRSVLNERANVCLGVKGVDPAKAANVAEEGDCIARNGAAAERVDCAHPTAMYKVLKRLSSVLGMDVKASCRSVEGFEEVYSWTWGSAGQFGDASRLRTDVVLCLGKTR